MLAREQPGYFLPWAEVTWLENHTPYSPRFDDIYWSRNDNNNAGLEEKNQVFIRANQLGQRFRQLQSGDDFTILETGFGFGLNFILAANLWQSISNCRSATLHYVAFEQYPVDPADLARLNSRIDQGILKQLIEKYPLPVPGEHQLWISDDICLTLIFGELNRSLAGFNAQVDACFLDGFSPSRNESMWTDNVFETIVKLSRPGASLSSYSVAGGVRRGLSRSGFVTEKVPGFGSKAEMLQAFKPGIWQARNNQPGKVCIVGAGLAGLHCAMALQRRNIPFALFEASENPMGSVANIDQISVCPQLSSEPQTSSLLSLRAFDYLTKHVDYHQSGRIQLLRNDEDTHKAEQLSRLCPRNLLKIISAATASKLAGVDLEHRGLFFPTAGWIDSSRVYSKFNDDLLNQQPNQQISPRVRFNCNITTFKKDGPDWVLFHNDLEIDRAEVLILATGSADREYLAPLHLQSVRGQSLKLSSKTHASNLIISGSVSLFPQHNDISTVSATFSRQNLQLDVSDQDTDTLLDSLNEFVHFEPVSYEAAVGLRSTTRDRLPVVGPVPDWQALDEHCRRPERDRHRFRFETFQPGLYCAVGFGSHGATLAPLCAEYLVRGIKQEPGISLPELSASRFELRDAGVRPR
ncbi:MAG TPA: FAD-dependent oxidoreductase [Pseudomonadales bacterium]|nr:FAD-dependent oxidoreductase [Pseudomonadales bacterium]